MGPNFHKMKVKEGAEIGLNMMKNLISKKKDQEKFRKKPKQR